MEIRYIVTIGILVGMSIFVGFSGSAVAQDSGYTEWENDNFSFSGTSDIDISRLYFKNENLYANSESGVREVDEYTGSSNIVLRDSRKSSYSIYIDNKTIGYTSYNRTLNDTYGDIEEEKGIFHVYDEGSSEYIRNVTLFDENYSGITQFPDFGNTYGVFDANNSLYVVAGSTIFSYNSNDYTSEWEMSLNGSIYSGKYKESVFYTVTNTGNITATDDIGNKLWTTNITSEYGIPKEPVFRNGNLILGYEGSTYVLDTDTGNVKWSTDKSGSPSLDGNSIYIPTSNSVEELSTEDGTLIRNISTSDIDMSDDIYDDVIIYNSDMYGVSDGKLFSYNDKAWIDGWVSDSVFYNYIDYTIRNGYLYIYKNGLFSKIDMNTLTNSFNGTIGKYRWDITSEGLSTPTEFGELGERGLYYYDTQNGNEVYMFDKISGDMKWNYGYSEFLNSGNVIDGTYFNGHFYIVAQEDGIYEFDYDGNYDKIFNLSWEYMRSHGSTSNRLVVKDESNNILYTVSPDGNLNDISDSGKYVSNGDTHIVGDYVYTGGGKIHNTETGDSLILPEASNIAGGTIGFDESEKYLYLGANGHENYDHLYIIDKSTLNIVSNYNTTLGSGASLIGSNGNIYTFDTYRIKRWDTDGNMEILADFQSSDSPYDLQGATDYGSLIYRDGNIYGVDSERGNFTKFSTSPFDIEWNLTSSYSSNYIINSTFNRIYMDNGYVYNTTGESVDKGYITPHDNDNSKTITREGDLLGQEGQLLYTELGAVSLDENIQLDTLLDLPLLYNSDNLIINELLQEVNKVQDYSRNTTNSDEDIGDTVAIYTSRPSNITVDYYNRYFNIDERALSFSANTPVSTDMVIDINNIPDGVTHGFLYKNGERQSVVPIINSSINATKSYMTEYTNPVFQENLTSTSTTSSSGYNVYSLEFKGDGVNSLCRDSAYSIDSDGTVTSVEDPQTLQNCLEADNPNFNFNKSFNIEYINNTTTININETQNITIGDNTTDICQNETCFEDINVSPNFVYETLLDMDILAEGNNITKTYDNGTLVNVSEYYTNETYYNEKETVVFDNISSIDDINVTSLSYQAQEIYDQNNTTDVYYTLNATAYNYSKQIDVNSTNESVSVTRTLNDSIIYNVTNVTLLELNGYNVTKKYYTGDFEYDDGFSVIDEPINNISNMNDTINITDYDNVSSIEWETCDAFIQRPLNENSTQRFIHNGTQYEMHMNQVEIEDEDIPYPSGNETVDINSQLLLTSEGIATTGCVKVVGFGSDQLIDPPDIRVGVNYENITNVTQINNTQIEEIINESVINVTSSVTLLPNVIYEDVPTEIESYGIIGENKTAIPENAKPVSGFSVDPHRGNATVLVDDVNRDAIDEYGATVYDYSVTADEGPVDVIVDTLDEYRRYDVYQDGEEWKTVETGSDGTFTVTKESGWSTHNFTIITSDSVARSSEDDGDDDSSINIGLSDTQAPDILLVVLGLLSLFLAGGIYWYYRKRNRNSSEIG